MAGPLGDRCPRVRTRRRSPGPRAAAGREGDDALEQVRGTAALEDRPYLPGGVNLAEVHQHQLLVLEGVGPLEDLVEVDVAAVAGLRALLAFVQERALEHQNPRGE